MNSVMLKMSLIITMLGVSCAASAVGIPIVDPSAPIKISESSSYSCDGNGNALDEGKPMHYKNQNVTCRNNNLWADSKALSFMDLTSEFMSEAIKVQSENEEKEATEFVKNYLSKQFIIVKPISKNGNKLTFDTTTAGKKCTVGVIVTPTQEGSKRMLVDKIDCLD